MQLDGLTTRPNENGVCQARVGCCWPNELPSETRLAGLVSWHNNSPGFARRSLGSRQLRTIAFCKATCAAPADAQGVGGSPGYWLIWTGPAWRPGWSLLSDLTHVVRPRDMFLQRSWPTRSVQRVAASHSQPATVGGSRAFLLAVVRLRASCPPVRAGPNALAGTRGANWRRPRPAAGDRIKVSSSQAAGEGRGASAATPVPQPSCVAPVHGGHATHAELCDRDTPTEHTLSRTGPVFARFHPQSREG